MMYVNVLYMTMQFCTTVTDVQLFSVLCQHSGFVWPTNFWFQKLIGLGFKGIFRGRL